MFVGADTDALRSIATRLIGAADACDDVVARSCHGAGDVLWIGPDADMWRESLTSMRGSEARKATRLMRDLGQRLRDEATQQDRTSATLDSGAGTIAVAAPSAAAIAASTRIGHLLDPGGFGVTHSDLINMEKVLTGLSPADRSAAIGLLTDRQLDIFRDQIHEGELKGGFSQHELAAFFAVVSPGLSAAAMQRLLGADASVVRSSAPIGAHQSANQAISSALRATTGGGPAQDEIEVRKLDSGKYIVVLPGVVDLTASVPQHVSAAELSKLGKVGQIDGTNQWDSPRDLHYAIPTVVDRDWRGSITDQNAYAFAVKGALQAAGVPPGADVMLVGHSFGAYTAMQLGADPSFNSATGSGYHVNVTNIVAAGAETGWMQPHLVNGTSVLSLRSTADHVAAAEAVASPATPASPHEVLFAGGSRGFGHDPLNYVDEVDRGDPVVSRYTAGVDPGYAAAGQAIRVTIHDAYRQSAANPSP